MNLYHWEYNSYATYYLDKGYYNQIALYASSLLSVNLGAELFRYMTRKQLMHEEDQQHFKHLRWPLVVMYITSIICYLSLNLLILFLNKPEMIKIYDPYNPNQSINDLSNGAFIMIHISPCALIVIILLNNIYFVEQDRNICMRFRGQIESSFMGSMLTAKKYSYLASILPFIVIAVSITVVFWFARCCGVITYVVCFIIGSQLTAFISDFENLHNMYGSIIAYANPDRLYERNEKYADVLTALGQTGKASKGLQVLGLCLSILMAFVKVSFIYTLEAINVFKFNFWGPIFLGTASIFLMKSLELIVIDSVTRGFLDFVWQNNFYYSFRMEKFIERLIGWFYCVQVPLMCV